MDTAANIRRAGQKCGQACPACPAWSAAALLRAQSQRSGLTWSAGARRRRACRRRLRSRAAAAGHHQASERSNGEQDSVTEMVRHISLRKSRRHGDVVTFSLGRDRRSRRAVGPTGSSNGHVAAAATIIQPDRQPAALQPAAATRGCGSRYRRLPWRTEDRRQRELPLERRCALVWRRSRQILRRSPAKSPRPQAGIVDAVRCTQARSRRWSNADMGARASVAPSLLEPAAVPR